MPSFPSSTPSTCSNSPEPSVAPKWQFWKKSKSKPKPDEESKYPPLPYWSLFRYSTSSERVLMGISITAAIIHGSLLPILTILFGRVLDEFGRLFLDSSDSLSITADEVPDTIENTTSIYLIIAFIAFVVSFIQLFCALTAATSMGNNLRRRFFQSLIAQDADFYDHAESGSLTHLVINDINLIQAGVGDKLATACQYLFTFICGIIVGFAYSWRLTCVMLGVAPFLLLAGFIFGNASAESTGDGLGDYGRAGAVASEVLGLIRTVTAFGAQKEEMKRYNSAIETAFYSSVKAAVASGLGFGSAMMLILFTYGLAMWYGGILVRNHGNSSGDVVLTFFATTLGASTLGTAWPAFKSFTVARAAAPRVFEIIDRISPINPTDDEGGIVPDAPVKGNITFEDVDFNYSTRVVEDGVSSLVLDSFNLNVPVSSSEAFVGESGCGKSTIGRLVQRCYDPQKGRILLDGVDLKELNVRWLRSQVGVVAQMPSLFMLSIRENIALGAGLDMSIDKVSGKRVFKRRDVTDEEIVAAAKMANAHDFVKKLPEGYNTMLGERGAMLSGGQKQRVCIARALVRNPKILLLDESTASLDTASERLVQDALEKAASGRTTITIAHRLSTVRHSDAISCIENGKVVERGSHDELLGKQDGYYKRLYDLQNVQRVKFEEEKAQDLDDESDNLMPFASMDEGSTRQDTISKVGVLEEEDEKGTDIDSGLFFRTLKFNSSEWPFMLCGTLGAILAGLIWPLASIPLVETIEALTKAVVDTDEVRKGALSFVVLGGMALFGNALQFAMLGISGELLAKKLRRLAFESLLRQEMGYFDMKENSLGALTGRLSSDAGATKGLTGDLYGIGIGIVGSLVAGLTISFMNCWRVTLVVLAIIPGVALGGYFEVQSSAGIDSSAHKDFAAANSSAAEAVDNVNTVRNLGSEDYFIGRFRDKIRDTIKGKRSKALLMGVAFGFSEFCQYLMWYASFKAGGDFVSAGHCTFKEMLLASMAILFSAITLGNISVFAPDVAASKIAATNVYRLIERKSEVDPTSPDGERIEKIEGRISVDNVHFEYPRRRDVPVLRGLTLDVSAGKTLALVGTSGHGKSTIIVLLERFYSIRSGRISVDEQDISKTNVQDLRSHIGLVSQEPELFNRSVFDNIAYGLSHEEGTPVSMADVEEAAKQANAHEFIEALPQGYDTLVGERGGSLSGGQRQRVAIARSLIRRPSLLLLDEATSALDGASERLVQEALSRAATGRTTIVVAHRLSTIRNADVIAVVRRGRIVESGTHDVLLRRNGAYTRLIENQLSEV